MKLQEQEEQLGKQQEQPVEEVEELKMSLAAEMKEKREILEELERYKVYLPEAEGLLQEVNGRHQQAMEEIQQQ